VLGRAKRAPVLKALYLSEVMMFEESEYKISDDREEVQLDQVVALLKKSYWAKSRNIETIKISISNSVCFSVFYDNLQVGFARVVTDYSSMAYIADVIIDDDHQGKGLGKWLMETIVGDSRWRDKFQFLATDDAHSLYEKFGFSGSVKLMSTKI